MRHVWFVARTDIAHLLRARETLMWTFVMPVVFFYFIGTITGGSMSLQGSAERPDPLALQAPSNSGFLVEELVHRLEQQHFKVERPTTVEKFEEFSRRLIVPRPASGKSVTEAVIDGEAQTVTFKTRAEGPSGSFDQVRVSRALYGLVADLVVAKTGNQRVDAAALAAIQTLPRGITLKVVSAGRRKLAPSGFEQAIPGSMVMFTMFVLLTSGAILLVIEREQGLLRRLASAPIPRWAVVAGKWCGRLTLGVVQVGFAMLAGTLLFKMRWGASFPMIALVMLVWASFNASLGLLLGNLARSRGQMTGIGVLSANVLGGLGGCWWPIEITPPWMQTLSRFLPTGWAMDALHKLISFGYDAPAALPHVLGLTAATIVIGALGVRTFKYQ